MAVVPKPNDGTKGLVEFYPTAEALLEVGMDQVYEPPHGSKFDVVECAVSSSSSLRYVFHSRRNVLSYSTKYHHHTHARMQLDNAL